MANKIMVTERMKQLAEMIEELLLELHPDAALLERIGELRALLNNKRTPPRLGMRQ